MHLTHTPPPPPLPQGLIDLLGAAAPGSSSSSPKACTARLVAKLHGAGSSSSCPVADARLEASAHTLAGYAALYEQDCDAALAAGLTGSPSGSTGSACCASAGGPPPIARDLSRFQSLNASFGGSMFKIKLATAQQQAASLTGEGGGGAGFLTRLDDILLQQCSGSHSSSPVCSGPGPFYLLSSRSVPGGGAAPRLTSCGSNLSLLDYAEEAAAVVAAASRHAEETSGAVSGGKLLEYAEEAAAVAEGRLTKAGWRGSNSSSCSTSTDRPHSYPGSTAATAGGAAGQAGSVSGGGVNTLLSTLTP